MSTSSHPLVSIVIDNYNYDKFLGESIDSVLNQTYDHVEVIVVDDGSTDNSEEVMNSYADKITGIVKKNGGQSSSINAGFKASQGDIICFLDADDFMQPEKISNLVSVFLAYPDVQWLFHPLKYVNTDTGEIIAGQYPPPPEDCSSEIDFRREIIDRATIPVWGPATSGLSFRRTLLEQILPMPESITMGIDWYLRYAAVSIGKGWVFPEPLATLRVHSSNAWTMQPETVKMKQKAKIFLLIGYWLKINFPNLEKMGDKVFSMGLGVAWFTGKIEDTLYQNMIKEHLSSVTLSKKIEILLRSAYHCFKTAAQR
jgi:glycosyltransferase involved in cell wall biosynthesis